MGGSNPSAAGYAWSALALVACQCHLPLLLAILAGTSAGAMIGSHWLIASPALTVTFVLSLGRALSMVRRGKVQRGYPSRAGYAPNLF
ncbi:MAG: mercury resistance protein [Rhizobiaceae bacterium]|nr:MAG: mercury resistance protein [Rhizobiaceae bacterium]